MQFEIESQFWQSQSTNYGNVCFLLLLFNAQKKIWKVLIEVCNIKVCKHEVCNISKEENILLLF